MMKRQERSPYGSGRKRGRVTIVTYAQSVLHTKGLLFFTSQGHIKLHQSLIPPKIRALLSFHYPLAFMLHLRWESQWNTCEATRFRVHQVPGKTVIMRFNPFWPKTAAKAAATTMMIPCTCAGRSRLPGSPRSCGGNTMTVSCPLQGRQGQVVWGMLQRSANGHCGAGVHKESCHVGATWET